MDSYFQSRLALVEVFEANIQKIYAKYLLFFIKMILYSIINTLFL